MAAADLGCMGLDPRGANPRSGAATPPGPRPTPAPTALQVCSEARSIVQHCGVSLGVTSLTADAPAAAAAAAASAGAVVVATPGRLARAVQEGWIPASRLATSLQVAPRHSAAQPSSAGCCCRSPHNPTPAQPAPGSLRAPPRAAVPPHPHSLLPPPGLMPSAPPPVAARCSFWMRRTCCSPMVTRRTCRFWRPW
jgi:hypothetical protein